MPRLPRVPVSCVHTNLLDQLQVITTLVLCALPLCASPANRLQQGADLARVQPLPNHHPAWASAANDAGPVPIGQSLNQLTLVLARSPEQEDAFVKFLADQQNPVSPDYHHWLTPAEVGERFGLSDSDIAVVTGWLQSQGLQVNWIAPSHLFIGFGGTASNISHAFQTQLRTYRVNGAQRMSVASDPLVPQALTPVIKSIRGLYTINEQPAHHVSDIQWSSPELTVSSTTHVIAPADFATIYDLPTATYTGSGTTIGIVGRSRTDPDDISIFQNLTSTYFSGLTEVIPTAYGGVDPGPAYTAPPSGTFSLGDQSEATLDVTRAGSVAPGASLLLVVSAATANNGDGIGADAQYLVQTTPLPAQVMSISFGSCESSAGPSGVSYWDTLFQQAAAEGISVFVASGDSGAAGCDAAFTAPPGTPTANSPNYICSSSYATCVGGTEFNDATNPTQYWSATNQNNFGSALSYILEGAWNEPLNSKSAPQVAATGGGVSAYIATPSWQTGTGVPAARSGRYTPDVSFSSSCHDAYFACLAAGGASCVPDSSGSFYFEGFCGTSAATPSMAGVAALLNQKLGGSQGNLNPALYDTAAATPGAFHDATVASSGVSSCTASTPSMCNNSATAAQPGYLLTTGYDEATGIGSLDVSSFLNNVAGTLIGPTVTVTPASNSITATQPLLVTITVAGQAGDPIPTGSVRLSGSNYTSPDTPLVSGAANITIPAQSLQASPNGSPAITLTAQYTPDSNSSTVYKKSSGTASITDSLISPTLTVTTSTNSLTTAQDLTVSVQVDGGSGNPLPTGWALLTANFSAGGYYSVQADVSSGIATFSLPRGQLAPGTDTFTAGYRPDTQSSQIYGTNSNSNTATVTVTQASKTTPTVTVSPSASSILSVQTLGVTVTVAGAAGSPAPNGSVVLSSGTYSSAPTPLVNGVTSISVPGLGLAISSDTLTATYSGDYNDNSATGSTSVSVTYPPKATPQIGITPTPSSITPNQPVSVGIGLFHPPNYPTPSGTVTLTAGTYISAPAALLSGGSAIFVIPGNTLPVGTDTITVSYSGDTYFNPVTNSVSEIVNPVTPPSFAITGTGLSISTPGATSSNATTLTITPGGGFTGNVILTAAVASGPANAVHPPTFTFQPSTINITGSNAATATLTVSTTAPTTGALTAPPSPRSRWYAAGGATLACIIFLWVPRRSRNLRNLLGTFALLVFLVGGILACGGGSGSSRSSGGSASSSGGTTPGNYTITITGTSGATTATGTVNLTVQ